MCTNDCTVVYVCASQRSSTENMSQDPSTLFVEAGPLTSTWGLLITLPWQAREGQRSSSPYLRGSGVKNMHKHAPPDMYYTHTHTHTHGCCGPNSGPNASTASNFLTELLPSLYIFVNINICYRSKCILII